MPRFPHPRGGALGIAALSMMSLLACQMEPGELRGADATPAQPTTGQPDAFPVQAQAPEPSPVEPAAPSPARWIPAPGTSWQIQFTGTLDPNVDAEVFDLDVFDTPESVIHSLKARGRKVICYFSAGSYEDWRPDASAFVPRTCGKGLDGWPGEQWLDIRAPEVMERMEARMDLAVRKGCDAVDLDNMDSFQHPTGFPLAARDQLHYNRTLAAKAHARGL